MRHVAGKKPNLRLRGARERRGWSQEYVAEQVGTNAFTVCRWERGTTFPRPHFRQKLSDLYGLDLDKLGLDSTLEAPEETEDAVQTLAESLVATEPPLMILPGGLVGRDDFLAMIKHRLFRTEGTSVTAIAGLPGVGKTTLAATLARDSEVAKRFPDGVLWAALGPAAHIPAILSAWGTSLGLSRATLARLPTTTDMTRAIHTTLSARRMLLIIDDVWRIEDALALRVGGDACAHLITTRFPPLAVQAARDSALTARELNDEQGLALLAQLAPETVDAFEQQAQALVRAVGGLPLALSLVGSYLRLHELTQQPRRIQAALQQVLNAQNRVRLVDVMAPLDHTLGNPSGTSWSLQAAIAASDTALSDQGRQALRALGAFPAKPNSFSEDAAFAVCAMSVDEVVGVLDELTDSGLLEAAAPGRYTMHQTIADYARTQVEVREPSERMVEHYVEFAERHADFPDALDGELSNLLSALEVAREMGNVETLRRGALGLAPFLLSRGLYDAVAKHLVRVWPQLRSSSDAKSAARCALYLGQAEDGRGNYAEAERYAREGLACAEQVQQESIGARLLHLRGVVANKLGNSTTALLSFEEGLPIARQSGDPYALAPLLLSIGELAEYVGDRARAETYLEEALAVVQHVGDPEQVSSVVQRLAVIAGKRGDFVLSGSRFREALAIARRHGYREESCKLLINLGVCCLKQGDFAAAEMNLQEALDLARTIGHRERVSAALLNLGSVAHLTGNAQRAEAYYRDGLTLAREMGHQEKICLFLKYLCMEVFERGDYAEAEALLAEGLDLARHIEHPRLICEFLSAQGDVEVKRGRAREASAVLLEALHLAVMLGIRETEAHILFGMAEAALLAGDEAEAQSRSMQSLEAFEAMKSYKAADVHTWRIDHNFMPFSSFQSKPA